MDLEARSLQPSAKAMMLAKLREYKSDLNKLKREFKKVASPNANQASREELMESGMDLHTVCQDHATHSLSIVLNFHQLSLVLSKL
jgi:vesicle transport through interaction with t-SNAREs protein 1